MDYNFHTHTYRCGHASGREEDYIKRAIDGRIKRMGFSDHIPYVFPDGFESPHRIPMNEVCDYFKTINELREKYKNQIEIYIGFEMEYYPEHFDSMLSIAKSSGAEYLILGQHFMYNEHPNGYPTQRLCTTKEEIEHYTHCIVSGIKSGMFTYVAHPDILNFLSEGENESIYREKMGEICCAAKETDTPLEINFLGIREKRRYPNKKFWKIAGEIGTPVTFGFDSHSVSSAYDKESLIIAEELVDKYKLNYIGEPKLKSLHF